MKSASIAVSLFTLTLAVAAPAIADEEETRPRVHIDASSEVVLERLDVHGDKATVCHAPCNKFVDPSGLYRITGDGIRGSSPFRIEPGASRVVLEPSTRSSGAFTAGIVLTTIATVFLAGGIFGAAGYLVDPDLYGVVGLFLGLPCFAASLATGIPGVILLANNASSDVTQKVSETSEARMRTPSFMSVPLLSGKF